MKTILIVEDEEALREIFKDELAETGYNVLTSGDARDCFTQLSANKVDLLILDIKLPDLSGLELLERIRKKYPDLPIIMASAYDSFRTDFAVWIANVSDYIVKPVDLGVLKEKIKKIIG
jgi:DNA-binding response OmpR family regulator